ncbi:unnamed protein product [Closterium sp. Naga37s-1]|nr:unnamed protein product [Closterium sp. Naga37s-1]
MRRRRRSRRGGGNAATRRRGGGTGRRRRGVAAAGCAGGAVAGAAAGTRRRDVAAEGRAAGRRRRGVAAAGCAGGVESGAAARRGGGDRGSRRGGGGDSGVALAAVESAGEEGGGNGGAPATATGEELSGSGAGLPAPPRALLPQRGITKQLMTSLKKGVLSQDMQHDRLVDLCVTVAATDLEFAMNHMVIELLRTDGLGEAKVVGLRALLAVVENALHQSNAATLMAPDRKSSALAGSAKPLGTTRQAPHVPFFGGPGGGGGGGGLPPGLPAPQMSQQQQMLMQQQKQQQLQKQQGAGAAGHAAHLSSRFGSVDYGRLGVGPAETAVMAPHMPRVRAALGAIIKQCHAAFGSLLLITPKTTIDMMSKDKVQSWQVFKWALRCMPHLIPEQWRNDKMTEIIPVYAISIDPHVRDEAVQVLFRTVRDLPQCRFPILRGMANFILKIPDEYPHLIHSSLVCLVQLLNAWRICLAYEASSSAAASGHGPGGPLAGAGAGGGAGGGPGGADLLARTRQVLAAHGGDDGLRFDPSGMDAVGLIFLCSADNKIRRTALELLRNVRALQRDLARLFAAGGEQQVEEDPPTTEQQVEEDPPTTYIIDIMEETGREVFGVSTLKLLPSSPLHQSTPPPTHPLPPTGGGGEQVLLGQRQVARAAAGERCRGAAGGDAAAYPRGRRPGALGALPQRYPSPLPSSQLLPLFPSFPAPPHPPFSLPSLTSLWLSPPLFFPPPPPSFPQQEEVVSKCYWDSGKWHELQPESDAEALQELPPLFPSFPAPPHPPFSLPSLTSLWLSPPLFFPPPPPSFPQQEEVVSKCYWDSGKWHELQPESDAEALQEVTLQHILEGSDQARWGRCLSELVKYCAELCPSSVQGARLEVVARMTPLSPADSSAKAGAGGDGDTKLEQWQLYAMFACACPPEDAPDGGEQSIKELVRLVLPMARSGAESSVYAATVALGHAHAGICEAMLTELMMWVEELLAEIEQRKWKNQKVRKEDMRVFMAQVYRLVAENLWPGVLPQRPWLRQLFLKFMDSTAQHVSKETGDAFLDAQPLRFALCSVVRCLSIELNGCASKRFDIKLRRQLFDLMASWCDEAGGLESMTSEFRREVERTKAAAMARTKDAAERAAVEKELNEQADAIHGMAMQALAALLHGPCFDEGLRKMSGKAVTWIRSLMESAAGTGQAAAGMGGMGMGMGMGMMGMGMGMGMMGMGMGMGGSPRDVFNRRKGGEGGHGKGVGNREWRSLFGSPSWRSMLGREALLNLLKTNPDIVPAIIDQCYNSDSELANGYFTVLAEVYMREECPQCELHRLLSLILYKVVDPCRSIRDDALQMLETMSMRDWADYTSSYSSSAGRYRAAVVGSLPDSYQQFQFQLSAKLAHEHPEMSELLCEEIMQRQLDAVNIIAQHQVLTCMAPWIENLNFAALWDSGWSERLLKSLYYVTWRHGDQFPDEIEKLWSTVAAKRRNIIPVINFLISKGLEDCDSAGGEITGALETYFSVAKRISLYLARISPQQTIDHLVYELSQRMSEEDAVDVSSSADQWQEDMSEILRFSHGCKLTDTSAAALAAGASPLPPLPGQVASAHAHHQHHHRATTTTAFGTVRSPFGSSTTTASPASSDFLRSSLSSASSSAASTLRSNSMHMNRSPFDTLGTFTMDFPIAPLLETTPSAPPAAPASASKPSNPVPNAMLMLPHVWLTRADFALILLAEIAYENDEDFRGHLPLLFHVTFVLMDSSEVVVLEHAQQLLVNLLYTLAGRHLELYDARDQSEGEYKQQVVSLIKYVQSKKGSLMWPNEDISLTHTCIPSATLLTSLMHSVVDAIFFQSDLRTRWGEKALKWLLDSASQCFPYTLPLAAPTDPFPFPPIPPHPLHPPSFPLRFHWQVVSLIKYVQSKKGSLMWPNEDISLTHTCIPSATLLTSLVHSVVDAIFFQSDLRTRWGEEALKWLLDSASRHAAARSHQMFRALRPHVTSDTCLLLLRSLQRCFSNPSPPILGFVMEILLTMQVVVNSMEPEKMILYPHVFWGCIALLHTDYVHVYTHALELFGSVIDRLSLHDQTTENILLSAMPLLQAHSGRGGRGGAGSGKDEEGGGGQAQQGGGQTQALSQQQQEVVSGLQFQKVQRLVLKGILSGVSHGVAIDVLSKITMRSCDRIFGDGNTRLLVHVVGLLPWLCVQLQYGADAAMGLLVLSSPLQQRLDKARAVAMKIAKWCVQCDLQALADVFFSYANAVTLTVDELLESVAPPICAQWFPDHTLLALGHLLAMLEKGPMEYHQMVLLILQALLRRTSLDATQSPLLYASVSRLLDSGHCREEALGVLEAILDSCAATIHRPAGSVSAAAAAAAAAAGGDYSPGFSAELLPSPDLALRLTQEALARVLDSYGGGRRTGKEAKRLVPFVDAGAGAGGSTGGGGGSGMHGGRRD